MGMGVERSEWRDRDGDTEGEIKREGERAERGRAK